MQHTLTLINSSAVAEEPYDTLWMYNL